MSYRLQIADYKLKRIAILSCFLCLTSCFCFSQCKIIPKYVERGFEKTKKKRTIDAIIVHSTFHANSADSFSVEGVLKQFNKYGVSAHYLIGRDGSIYNLVKEEDISYHAGVSSLPDGRKNINPWTIGIEVMTSYKSSPTAAQYEALKCLIKDIESRYTIKYLLRHSDIAPVRKTDPWNFDWDKLNDLQPKR